MHRRHRILKLFLPALILAAFVPSARAGDAEFYAAKCAKCHKLYDAADYDDTQWDGWMAKMRKKARLNDKNYERIARYAATLRKK